MTNSIAEIAALDMIFVIGSNTTETHPVIGTAIRRAVQHGAKLLVAEPREIDLCMNSELFLQIKPGTNVALINGMMKVILEEHWQDDAFIQSRTEGFDALQGMLQTVDVAESAAICGISEADLRAAAKLYGTAKHAGIFYAMGITQHTTGTDGVRSLANLAMLCGQVGKPNCGINPLRGQNNVQGSCDMGALPGDLTGYQKVANPEVREKFAKAWGLPVPSYPGKTVTEIFDAIEQDEIDFLYIMGENPLVSDPDQNHTKRVLAHVPFLVVQDIFLTETAELADVVLPAASFAEKDGTFTNTERRVQRVRQAIQPVGNAKADWQILQELMQVLGYETSYQSPADIMAEIAALTPSYGGINYQRLDELGSLQWPCPNTEHPGTPVLHLGQFTRGLGKFIPCPYQTSAETPDETYPYLFTTGRVLYQYHTATMTGKTAGIQEVAGQPYAEINRQLGEKLRLADGDLVELISRRGSVKVPVRLRDGIDRQVIFMPFHYAAAAANLLTNRALDPDAKIPELKVCAVQLKRCRE